MQSAAFGAEAQPARRACGAYRRCAAKGRRPWCDGALLRPARSSPSPSSRRGRPATISFPARICETFDGMGNIISKSRCYRSGNDTRCDTQTFGGQTAPNGNGLQLVVPDAGWRYSQPNGDRPQR